MSESPMSPAADSRPPVGYQYGGPPPQEQNQQQGGYQQGFQQGAQGFQQQGQQGFNQPPPPQQYSNGPPQQQQQPQRQQQQQQQQQQRGQPQIYSPNPVQQVEGAGLPRNISPGQGAGQQQYQQPPPGQPQFQQGPPQGQQQPQGQQGPPGQQQPQNDQAQQQQQQNNQQQQRGYPQQQQQFQGQGPVFSPNNPNQSPMFSPGNPNQSQMTSPQLQPPQTPQAWPQQLARSPTVVQQQWQEEKRQIKQGNKWTPLDQMPEGQAPPQQGGPQQQRQGMGPPGGFPPQQQQQQQQFSGPGPQSIPSHTPMSTVAANVAKGGIREKTKGLFSKFARGRDKEGGRKAGPATQVLQVPATQPLPKPAPGQYQSPIPPQGQFPGQQQPQGQFNPQQQQGPQGPQGAQGRAPPPSLDMAKVLNRNGQYTQNVPISPHPGNLVTYAENYAENGPTRSTSVATTVNPRELENDITDDSRLSFPRVVGQYNSGNTNNGAYGNNNEQIREEEEDEDDNSYRPQEYRTQVGEKPVLPPIAPVAPIDFRERAESRQGERDVAQQALQQQQGQGPAGDIQAIVAQNQADHHHDLRKPGVAESEVSSLHSRGPGTPAPEHQAGRYERNLSMTSQTTIPSNLGSNPAQSLKSPSPGPGMMQQQYRPPTGQGHSRRPSDMTDGGRGGSSMGQYGQQYGGQYGQFDPRNQQGGGFASPSQTLPSAQQSPVSEFRQPVMTGGGFQVDGGDMAPPPNNNRRMSSQFGGSPQQQQQQQQRGPGFAPPPQPQFNQMSRVESNPDPRGIPLGDGSFISPPQSQHGGRPPMSEYAPSVNSQSGFLPANPVQQGQQQSPQMQQGQFQQQPPPQQQQGQQQQPQFGQQQPQGQQPQGQQQQFMGPVAGRPQSPAGSMSGSLKGVPAGFEGGKEKKPHPLQNSFGISAALGGKKDKKNDGERGSRTSFAKFSSLNPAKGGAQSADGGTGAKKKFTLRNVGAMVIQQTKSGNDQDKKNQQSQPPQQQGPQSQQGPPPRPTSRPAHLDAQTLQSLATGEAQFQATAKGGAPNAGPPGPSAPGAPGAPAQPQQGGSPNLQQGGWAGSQVQRPGPPGAGRPSPKVYNVEAGKYESWEETQARLAAAAAGRQMPGQQIKAPPGQQQYDAVPIPMGYGRTVGEYSGGGYVQPQQPMQQQQRPPSQFQPQQQLALPRVAAGQVQGQVQVQGGEQPRAQSPFQAQQDRSSPSSSVVSSRRGPPAPLPPQSVDTNRSPQGSISAASAARSEHQQQYQEGLKSPRTPGDPVLPASVRRMESQGTETTRSTGSLGSNEGIKSPRALPPQPSQQQQAEFRGFEGPSGGQFVVQAPPAQGGQQQQFAVQPPPQSQQQFAVQSTPSPQQQWNQSAPPPQQQQQQQYPGSSQPQIQSQAQFALSQQQQPPRTATPPQPQAQPPQQPEVKITPPPSPSLAERYPVVLNASGSGLSNPAPTTSQGAPLDSEGVPVVMPIVHPEFADEKIPVVDEPDEEETIVMSSTSYPGQAWEPECFWMND
ncbi:hypothetical protein DFH27DRAFT_557850 [Peziza echinospora]|nr:hypothetical protein DFH27DRAFT_557850 [Peziza echinospora]